jgi:outer membrane protein OmpA-like peptidoglycan-associated protein
MAVGWHGETDLRVATGNGVAQPQNRRVEINIP